MRLIGIATSLVGLIASVTVVQAAETFTIFDAITQAVQTNPGIGEAAANRRATETELRQNQSTLLPQIRVEGKTGRVKYDFQDALVPPQGNNQWLNGREVSVFGRQLLFDGFKSINEIWRQAARVDAAAYRVRERTELIALDAAEAYINVTRYLRLISLADENLRAHQRILTNVQARFEGGRAGEGDLEQVRERVQAAIAILAQFRQQYDEARGAFRKVIGIEPHNLRGPARLRGLPRSKDESLATTLRHNPTIQAAESDREAAKYGFHATSGDYLPTVALEGRALRGVNTATTFGTRTDMSAMVVASWDVFRGGQDLWKRSEMAERYQEQTMRHARLQRDAFESIDKAWAARTVTGERITALTGQIAADQKVITAYQKEYELGQRSLIDLLNAQNQLFNAFVSVESTRSVAVFADYQLLAAMGHLLEYMKGPRPVDSEPLEPKPFGLIPGQLPPILLKLPEPPSEPINVGRSAGADYAAAVPSSNQARFTGRGLTPQQDPVMAWMQELSATRQGLPSRATAYAPERPLLPAWLVSSMKIN
jgi:adhesin transport system outer membrane protein